ncbi:Saccharopine dehydrogenase [Labilithrix luteola]|uniref:Saccharopine dehydrogenase n=1 Tax=Labilithrix luteola TaxID=1391654 RepID=A0A0K1Q3Y4_9BACT|nr:saccharopine dehydrogenase NADP-binding domain-containing protein [Labilithrix luteola]AKV00546.1 Saccharopine dehydrogenase [Labilithrix luteola]
MIRGGEELVRMTKSVQEPVLIVGGSGVVGSRAAKALRKLHPHLPVAIGGRDLEKASAVASEIGNADAVRIDLDRTDLGQPEAKRFSAVVMFVKDTSTNALLYAQDKGVPYVDVSTATFEIAPEVALYASRPSRSPIVLASHWLAGAALLPTLHFAEAYAKVDTIAIGAVLDEQDMGGPAAYADYERITQVIAEAQIFEDGKWVWASGDRSSRVFSAVDGVETRGQAYSVFDTMTLAAATGARSVRVDLVLGESASRRRGEPFSTEFVIELAGVKHDGSSGRSRHELVHREGQAPVTAAAVATIVERLLGLVGEPVSPGLYLPNAFITPAHMLERLAAFGTQIRSL